MKKQESQSQIDFTVDDEDIYSAMAKRPDTTTAVEHENDSLFRDRSYLGVMADDSASQMNNQQNKMQLMRDNPFLSNLENAKMLALNTKDRVLKMGNLELNKGSDQALSQQAQYQECQKVNKYLSGALRHLNITIDVLLEQYNPSKYK